MLFYYLRRLGGSKISIVKPQIVFKRKLAGQADETILRILAEHPRFGNRRIAL